jgi:hypothetical protein
MAVAVNLILGAHFDTVDFFLDLSAGDKKPTIIGSPALIAGKFGNAVSLSVTANDELNWSSTGLLAALVQTGCVSIWVQPTYSGSPAIDQVFYFSGASSVVNRVAVLHTAAGNLEGHIYSSGGVSIATISSAWVPVATTWYNLELNFDVTAGASRLFVNGTQHGATHVGAGVRSNSSTLMNVGALPAVAPANTFAADELLVYNAVQHVADFTPATVATSLIYETDPIPMGVVEGW